MILIHVDQFAVYLVWGGIMDGDNIENSLNGLFNSIGMGAIVYQTPKPIIKKRPRGRPKGSKNQKEVEKAINQFKQKIVMSLNAKK